MLHVIAGTLKIVANFEYFFINNKPNLMHVLYVKQFDRVTMPSAGISYFSLLPTFLFSTTLLHLAHFPTWLACN